MALFLSAFLRRSQNKKRPANQICRPFFIALVRQAGFEPATYGFVVRRSIRAELLALMKTFEIQVVHKLMCFCCQCLLFSDKECLKIATN